MCDRIIPTKRICMAGSFAALIVANALYAAGGASRLVDMSYKLARRLALAAER